MRFVRITQIIEIVEAHSEEKANQGNGKLCRACNHPLLPPLESLLDSGGLLLDVNAVAGVIAPSGTL